MKAKLTPKQQMFVAEYLTDLNATKAAIAAGYSVKTAYSQGQRLLKNVEVARAVGEKTEKRAERLELDADMVLAEIKKSAFVNMGDFISVDGEGDPRINLSGLTPEQSAAIQEVTHETFMQGRGEDKREITQVRMKLTDKLRALELLGRHLKLFTDKVEVSGMDELYGRIQRARQSSAAQV